MHFALFLLIDTLLASSSWISQPWHWAVSGLAIALSLFLLTWMGESLAVSATFKMYCGMVGLDKVNEFFKLNFRKDHWRLAFVLGITLGGTLAVGLIPSPQPVQISPDTQAAIAEWGIQAPGSMGDEAGFVPVDLFQWSNLRGVLMAILGGFLVGFGSRYARGCTSGHAITGLSHLQLPSLLTVIGFFIGGLIMTWFILPVVFA